MKKVTVVGAGNVGATCANVLAQKNFLDEVVLIDVKEGLAEGKALDIWQTSAINHFDTRVSGYTKDFSKSKDSEVVVVTSGVPRKPGMSRDDLIYTNAKIMIEVVGNIMKYAPDAIILVVANPLDVMTYVAHKASGKSANKVFGMAGVLDTARYRAFLATEIGVSPNVIQALLMGGHGDTMLPLPRYTTVAGIPVTELIEPAKLDSIIERTKKGGGEIVGLLGTSAWYAPGAAAAKMVDSIINNKRLVFPVCVKLDGQWRQKNVYLGSPVMLGRKGIEKIIEVNLHYKEMKELDVSAKAVKSLMKLFDDMNLLKTKKKTK